MKFETLEVAGFAPALHGMRHPMESYDRSDSKWHEIDSCGDYCDECTYDACHGFSDMQYIIGKNDMDLAKKLIAAGSEHRKFLRQIMVWVDITAPLYWWKEFDTYKVGTTANSTSTMHKLATTPITLDCFETDDLMQIINITSDNEDACIFYVEDVLINYINFLENLRVQYLKTKAKTLWKELIRLLPESWLQTRTISMSYENVLHIYHQRKNHKLTEWHQFCRWVETLSCFKEMCLNATERIKIGDVTMIFTGSDNPAKCEIIDLDSDTIQAKILPEDSLGRDGNVFPLRNTPQVQKFLCNNKKLVGKMKD